MNSNIVKWLDLLITFLLRRNIIYRTGYKLVASGLAIIIIGISPPYIFYVVNLLSHELFNKQNIFPTGDVSIIIIILGCLFIFIGLVIILLEKTGYFNKIILKKEIVIKHWSLDNPVFGTIERIHENHKKIEFRINMTRLFKTGNPKIKRIKRYIKIQDKITCRISRFLRNSKNVVAFNYFSITSLPFVGRLAFLLGDSCNYNLFENRKLTKEGFKELNNEKIFPMLNIITKEFHDNKDLTLIIGMRNRIDTNEIPSHLSGESFLILENENIKSEDSICDDSIISYQQIKQYSLQIAQLVRESRSKSVHVFYAGPTTLLFEFCSKISMNYDPHYYLYHYFRGSYPWGLKITEKKPIVIDLTTFK